MLEIDLSKASPFPGDTISEEPSQLSTSGMSRNHMDNHVRWDHIESNIRYVQGSTVLGEPKLGPNTQNFIDTCLHASKGIQLNVTSRIWEIGPRN